MRETPSVPQILLRLDAESKEESLPKLDGAYMIGTAIGRECMVLVYAGEGPNFEEMMRTAEIVRSTGIALRMPTLDEVERKDSWIQLAVVMSFNNSQWSFALDPRSDEKRVAATFGLDYSGNVFAGKYVPCQCSAPLTFLTYAPYNEAARRLA